MGFLELNRWRPNAFLLPHFPGNGRVDNCLGLCVLDVMSVYTLCLISIERETVWVASAFQRHSGSEVSRTA